MIIVSDERVLLFWWLRIIDIFFWFVKSRAGQLWSHAARASDITLHLEVIALGSKTVLRCMLR